MHACEYHPKNSFLLPNASEKAWETLVSRQYVDQSLLRKEIALSWQRCLQYAIRPNEQIHVRAEADYPGKFEENQLLIRVASSHMQRLYDAIKNNHCIVVLSCPDGVILKIVGDSKIRSSAEAINLVEGQKSSEQELGTTAPGVCAAAQIPIQVFLQEHFSKIFHNWCCSAAPIFSTTGQLAGTIDISNINKSLHAPYFLELVKSTAKAIEMELNYSILEKKFKTSHFFFTETLNNLPNALFFIDQNDKISFLNSNAQKIMGPPSADFLGKQAKTLIPNFSKLKKSIGDNATHCALQVKNAKGAVKVYANIRALHNELHEPVGIVGSIKGKHTSKNKGNSANYTFSDFIYRSKRIKTMLRNVTKMAATDINILIQGESGTGKEILAQAIHNASDRREKPFIAVNCAALAKELLQSELFGYEGGAFTGADKKGKAGKFELAEEGTIFLDEIGEMPVDAQANLLRVLQEKNLVRVGGSLPVPLDVRVIAATNKDLPREMELGNFRQDLFYRLAVISVSIPPLREREEDLWCLINHFIQKYGGASADAIHFSTEAQKLIEAYNWPGNVRELENTVILFLNNMEGSTVTPQDLPESLERFSARQEGHGDFLKKVERDAILLALRHCEGNLSRTAAMLGISRATLYRKIDKYNIDT